MATEDIEANIQYLNDIARHRGWGLIQDEIAIQEHELNRHLIYGKVESVPIAQGSLRALRDIRESGEEDVPSLRERLILNLSDILDSRREDAETRDQQKRRPI